MSNVYQCEVCNKSFNVNNHEKCPSCKTPYIDPRAKEIVELGKPVEDVALPKKFSPTQPSVKSTTSRTTHPSDPLVEAQNRTTHAVRSLAITFVAAPIIFVVVGGLIAVSLSTQNILLIVLALIIAIVAFGWTLISSLSELGKSKVR